MVSIDETDMQLIKALWEDSRASFNSLGKKLDISGNILKKRAEKLEVGSGEAEDGVFSFHTNPVFSKFGYALVAFTADIPKHHRNHYIETIAQFQEIYEIMFSLEEKCAIIVLLPFNSPDGVKQDTIIDFKQRFNQTVKDIKLGEYFKLEYAYSEGKPDLKESELKLLRLLRTDSRRDLIDLSKHLDLSKKTLSRYLSRFEEEKLIKHTIGLQPSRIRNFIIHFLIIKFEDDKDLYKKVNKILERIPNHLSYFVFVEPAGIALYVYSETLADMEEIMIDLYMRASIREINVFFPSSIVRFKAWKDMVIPLPEEKISR